MRAVVQRVSEASVRVGDEVVGAIGTGMLVLLGVAREDDAAVARGFAERVAALRIFDDAAGRMNLALREVGGAMLVVSQFTLWGDCRSGRRPSWSRAAAASAAEPLYREFVSAVRALGVPTAEGRFGATMRVALVNDGPVTLLIDTEGRF
ncbi:MAG TPA: D-aminoacyl-tRNA deacylase [Candidatus Binatia bacterium]|nr:D-aminoacyl-tRNA deacylase [Candidatus Binatia bacterium]